MTGIPLGFAASELSAQPLEAGRVTRPLRPAQSLRGCVLSLVSVLGGVFMGIVERIESF